MGLAGIVLGLALLIGMAYRGWSVLGLAPIAALVAAAASGEPLLAHWTRTFMLGAGSFVAQFFPLFLLGALFGKLMEDSGSIGAIAQFMTTRLGPGRAILAVVLAGALVTYGGESIRGDLRPRSDGTGAVQHGRHSESASAGCSNARHLDVHHVGVAGDTLDSKRHTDAALRHVAVRGTRVGADRFGDHAWIWVVVATPT